MTKRAYKEFSVKFSKRGWVFLMKMSILSAAVVAGLVILWYAGHSEYRALVGAGGVAKFLEIVAEAAQEAYYDDV